MEKSAEESARHRRSGIIMMLCAMFCFICLDTTIKLLVQTYSVVEVSWARFFFGTIFSFIFVYGLVGQRLPRLLISHTPYKQSLRSLLLLGTAIFFIAGLSTTPLPTATTIMFMSPIMVTLLSIPLLKEHVGPRRWLGIAIGFLGAAIVIRPWNNMGSSLGFGMLLVFLSALINANYQIVTRMVRGDDPLTSLLFTAGAGTIVTSLALPWFWVTPDLKGWFLLAFTGLIGSIGHLCLIRAFQLAPASTLAPFSYSTLIWATLFGFLLWGYWPDGYTWAGAGLIIGSGLYIFYREQKTNPSNRASDDQVGTT